MVICRLPADPGAGQGLLGAVFFAGGHQAGHLFFGDFHFFTAKTGQANIFNLVWYDSLLYFLDGF
jgi:hypothetical protein